MRKLFMIMWVALLLCAARYSAGQPGKNFQYVYPITQVAPAHDGDTFDCRFLIMRDIEVTKRIRLLGCDAVELNTPNGIKAREFTRAFLSTTTQTLTLITQGKYDNFSRLLADVERGGTRLSDALTSAGLTTGRFRVQEVPRATPIPTKTAVLVVRSTNIARPTVPAVPEPIDETVRRQ